MKKFFMLSVLMFSISGVFFPKMGYAQFRPGEGADRIVTGPNCLKFFVIKTSITGPLQLFPVARLAFEIPTDSQFSIQPEVGYLYKYAYNLDRLETSHISYEATLSGHYYIPRSSLMGLYTGPRLTYRALNYIHGHNEVDNGEIVFSSVGATHHRRNDADVMWELGIQPVVAKRLALNFLIALGPRFSITQNLDEPNHKLMQSGANTSLAALFNVNIGYVFCH